MSKTANMTGKIWPAMQQRSEAWFRARGGRPTASNFSRVMTPTGLDWARHMRSICGASGVPFFMKQMGGTRKPFPPIPADLMVREFPKGGGA